MCLNIQIWSWISSLGVPTSLMLRLLICLSLFFFLASWPISMLLFNPIGSFLGWITLDLNSPVDWNSRLSIFSSFNNVSSFSPYLSFFVLSFKALVSSALGRRWAGLSPYAIMFWTCCLVFFYFLSSCAMFVPRLTTLSRSSSKSSSWALIILE